MSRPRNTKELFEALGNVIDKTERGAMAKDQATSIIESAKVMTSILNYELKLARTKHELGQKNVKINDVTS